MRGWVCLCLLVLGQVGAGRGRGASDGPPRHRAPKRHLLHQANPKERRPNIVLILTDDQDVELGSLNYMNRTLKLLRDEGAEFRHAYTTTPMCCPSRSSMLTGMYMHNHHVYTNKNNCSSPLWQATHETRSFATYLSNAGYRTGYFGKYLNKYNGSYIPPGWREWGGLIMNSRYYNYSVNHNGKRINHGDDYAKDYYPDLIANDSVAFLQRSKQVFGRKPVMLVLGFPAPHGPEDSAPQYSNMFFNVTSHHTPSYDFAPNPDKQWILQVTGQMRPIHRQFTDLLMTKRLQTLQSVDAAVEKIYNELKSLGELDNTYIIYTSDHGYHLGQFGLIKGKSFPFEFDVRVPFLVRGPGIEPGTIIDELVLNIDLAPTFLDIAGVETPPHMDGRSFLSLLNRRHRSRSKLLNKWPDTFLIESSGRRETGEETKLKEAAMKEKELNQTVLQSRPDLPNDGHLDNQLLPVVSIGKLERLAMECQKPEFKAPCKPGQKWECLPEGNRWRKHKCKIRPKPMYYRGKKCACFTPEGVMYDRRLPREFNRGLPNKSQRIKFIRPNRMKRETKTSGPNEHLKTLIEIYKYEGVGDAIDKVISGLDMEKGNRRNKRSAIEQLDSHISLKMGEIKDRIDGLQASSNDSNVIGLNLGTNCSVGNDGDVFCTEDIYQDPKAWKASRDKLDEQIRKLKLELDHLKEIRKHLKQKRPHQLPYDQSAEEEDEEDGEDEDPVGPDDGSLESRADEEGEEGILDTSDFQIENTTKDVDANKEKNKHRHHHNEPPPPWQSSIGGHQAKDESSIHKNKDVGVPSFNQDAMDPAIIPQPFLPDTCYCERDLTPTKEKDVEKESRKRQKEERIRKRERKLRRKAKLDAECLSEKMNCFNHDNQHWKTPPFWTEGPFCFCMNANNNSYSCLRTINATHNFLYCEFVTGFITYYNLRIDPFEQKNRFNQLSSEEKSFLHDQLEHLKGCKGTEDCTVSGINLSLGSSSAYPKPSKKRKFNNNPLDPGDAGMAAATGSRSGDRVSRRLKHHSQ